MVGELRNLLRFWLEGTGVSTPGATAISERFPTYFVYALNEEWRENAKSYRPLVEALDTPFAKAAARESAWAAYESLLQKRTQEAVFDEPFSLAQIFVPLNAYYFDQTALDSSREELGQHESRPRIVVRLHDELERWVQHSDSQDSLRVISGGPGSGKSSFAKMFAAELAAKHRRALFVPLHLIDASKDLVEEVGRFVQDEGVLARILSIPARLSQILQLFSMGLMNWRAKVKLPRKPRGRSSAKWKKRWRGATCSLPSYGF